MKRFVMLVALLLVAAATALAQGVIKDEFVRGPNGDGLIGATVWVCKASAPALPVPCVLAPTAHPSSAT